MEFIKSYKLLVTVSIVVRILVGRVSLGGWDILYYWLESDIGDERLGSGSSLLMQVVVNKRKTNRLNLDSEEEARLEAEEQARLDKIRQRKE